MNLGVPLKDTSWMDFSSCSPDVLHIRLPLVGGLDWWFGGLNVGICF